MGLFSSEPTPAVPDDIRRRAEQVVCEQFASDGLQPHEVDVRPDGSIWIDRRAKASWAVPLEIGRWQ